MIDGVQNYSMNWTYSRFFFLCTLWRMPERNRGAVAIQTLYLLSTSPETRTQSGLITVDSESLQTYSIVTFLSRYTDHFLCSVAVSSRLKNYLLVPHELCSHSLSRQNWSTEIPNQRCAFMSCMIWHHSPASSLSITHLISMQHSWLPAWLIVPETVNSMALALYPAAETMLMPGVVICADNSITVKCSDTLPCDELEQSTTLCEKFV